MADIDINKVQQNIKELQDQNAIDFQNYELLTQKIEEIKEAWIKKKEELQQQIHENESKLEQLQEQQHQLYSLINQHECKLQEYDEIRKTLQQTTQVLKDKEQELIIHQETIELKRQQSYQIQQQIKQVQLRKKEHEKQIEEIINRVLLESIHQ